MGVSKRKHVRNQAGGAQGGDDRTRSSVWRTIAMLTLLMSLVSAIGPSMSPVLAALPGALPVALPACDGGQVVDPNSGECADPTEVVDAPTEIPPTDIPAPTEIPSPTDEVATETPIPTIAALANVEISKFTCPVNFSPVAADANAQTDCTQMTNDVIFVLTLMSGPLQSNTGDSVNGKAVFASIEPGAITITEQLPPGTDSTFHYCAVTGNPTSLELGPAFSGQVNAGETMTCSWYNVPAPEVTPTATSSTVASPSVEATATATAMLAMTMTPTMSDGTPATPSSEGDLTVYKWMCPAVYDEMKAGTNPVVDCTTPKDGITFTLKDDANVQVPLQTNTGDSIPGAVHFGSVVAGAYHLVETTPVDIHRAFVSSCSITTGTTTTTITPIVVAGAIELAIHGGDVIVCNWYNVPPLGTSDLTIHKQLCNGGTYTSDADCAPYNKGVNFTVSMKSGASFVPVTSGTTNSLGVLPFTGLAPGTYQIAETGWTPCDVKATRFNDAGVAVNALNGDGTIELVNGKETVVTVSNCLGRGDITVYKWTCAPGYDYTKPGANPPIDCTTATNGVNFRLTDNAGVQIPLQTMTGDSMAGAVSFGGTVSGDYTLTEDIPAGIQQEFVWNCTGASTSWVHPMPLAIGPKLAITVANGDKIVCNWFNVPKPDPQSGDLTVHKQLCSGTVFTSPVDCDTFEGGATFQILAWNGTTWVPVTTATTNNVGVIALTGLAPGTYLVKETGGNPCNATAIQLDGAGKPINVLNAADGTVPVTNGKETVVTVFNCRVPGKKPVPTKTASKFPNTGVDPAAGQVHSLQQDTQVIEPETPTAVASPGTPDAVACPAITTADGAVGTPSATPEAGQDCARGQVPMTVRIPAIQVEATVEVKEILDGEMQQPTDEKVVTWYKETARLGEIGNVVIAGHLNWWGFPEAIFFNLSTLKAGDAIEVSDGSGGTFTYAVTTVRQLPATDGPEEIVKGTDAETITLITCSGEWDPSVSEYDSRTVVQAVRVQPAP